MVEPGKPDLSGAVRFIHHACRRAPLDPGRVGDQGPVPYLPPDMQRFSRLIAWQRVLEARLTDRAQGLINRLPRLGVDENTLLLGFALAIGAVVGGSVIVFYTAIDVIQSLAITAASRITFSASFSILLVVILGLSLTRLLIRYGTNDSDGYNIPDVMRAIAKRGGVIHSVPVAVKTAAAALTMGVGGSVGAEGPVAVAGSALGSKTGRLFRSGPARLKVLVGCGAAAGISAAFNAPIAGVFFSLEKVVGSFGVTSFPPVLVASVISAAISRAAFGDTPVIAIPTVYSVGPARELVMYAVLGVVTGGIAVLYTRGVHGMGDLLGRLRLTWQRVVAGALLVGVLDIVFRADLWGRGHESFSIEMIGGRAGGFLIALAFAKLIATATTITITRAGGVFTPAMFIGATLAGGLAVLADLVLPGFTIEPEAFALVGMAGLVAGATHAPLTAIMIVFEMTGDYALILPLMLCGAISYITARRIYPESVYSEWLVRRGENIHSGRDTAVLERLSVKDCYNNDPHVIGENATVPQIVAAISNSPQIEFPVLDSDLTLVGMITFDDLRTVLTDAETLAPVVLAGDLAKQQYEWVTPDDSLRTALQKLAVRGSHHIPVLDGEGHDRLLGLISRNEILSAYDRELLRQQEGSH
jgi:CIC family chloride channel protein